MSLVDVKLSFTEDRKGWDRILAAMADADNLALAWGVFKGEIAQYAMFNEFGTRFIPSRPFLRTSVDNNQPKYMKLIAKAYKDVTGLKAVSWQNALNQIGLRARNDVVKNMLQGFWTPNLESTRKTKKSSRPLIDTGAMRNAIQWAIGKVGEFK